MERAIAFIVEQQAQVTTRMDSLIETVESLSGTVGTLSGTVEKLSGKVDRTADSASALLAIAEIHDREIKETDERLNALINIVERHINEGRNGKA